AIDTTRDSPGRTELVALAEHTIESKHEPSLDVYLDGNRIEQIRFVLLLEIEVRGLLLEIERGTLRKMTTGEIQLKGTFQLVDFALGERGLEPIRIPGEIRLSGSHAAPSN